MAANDSANKQTEQMFALIGRCITQWTFVEEALCNLFSVCTSPVTTLPPIGLDFHDSQVSITIFYSVESFRAKLNLADAAITSTLEVSGARHFAPEWARLKEKARKLSLKRNRLAHWTVMPAFEYTEIYPASLVPPIGSMAYYRETGAGPSSVALKPLHVEHLDRAFCLITQKIKEFTFRVASDEKLFDRDARLLVRRIRSLEDTAPRRAERLRLAASTRM